MTAPRSAGPSSRTSACPAGRRWCPCLPCPRSARWTMTGRTTLDDVPDAMPAGPSGPAQPGVITAVVAAITAAGTATSAAALTKAPRRATGRSAREGRHSSAAHPTISPNSRTQLTTSSAPTDSGLCTSGPNGRPTVRDATYTAITIAFPPMPSHSQSRDGRQSKTAGHITGPTRSPGRRHRTACIPKSVRTRPRNGWPRRRRRTPLGHPEGMAGQWLALCGLP